MKRLIERSKYKTVVEHTDAHNPTRQVYRTVYHDDEALDKNRRLRRDGLMVKGHRLPMFDGQRVHYAFSIPADQLALFQRDNPDFMTELRSKDDAIRMKAALRLAILHPEWSVLAD